MPRENPKIHENNPENPNHRKSHHHHHNHAKKQLKASSMATRNPTDKKKLLTKTYSEIGVNNNNNNSHTGAPGTPTPSEKVSKWHRDILLVSPAGQNPHPRQCICDQCMAEYGTYRIYNQLLDNPSSTVIKGGFPIEIKTKIRYLIICCYHNFIL